MEELLELLLEEIENERRLYARTGSTALDVEPRAINALAHVLLRVKTQLRRQRLENQEG